MFSAPPLRGTRVGLRGFVSRDFGFGSGSLAADCVPVSTARFPGARRVFRRYRSAARLPPESIRRSLHFQPLSRSSAAASLLPSGASNPLRSCGSLRNRRPARPVPAEERASSRRIPRLRLNFARDARVDFLFCFRVPQFIFGEKFFVAVERIALSSTIRAFPWARIRRGRAARGRACAWSWLRSAPGRCPRGMRRRLRARCATTATTSLPSTMALAMP